MNEFVALYRFLRPQRRRALAVTLLLMLAGAAAEMVTIGAVLPFLAFVAEPGSALVPARVREALVALGGSEVAGAAAALVAAATAAAALRLLLAWKAQTVVAAIGTDLAAAAFGRTMRLPYEEQVRRNSSRTVSLVQQVQRVVNAVLLPSMHGTIALVIGVAVAFLLFKIDAVATAIGAVAAILVYVAIILATRPVLRRNARTISAAAAEETRLVQEGAGGIRDVLLDRTQDLLEARFRAVDRRYRRTQAVNAFLGQSPRFVTEAAGVAALALVALAMSLKPGGIAAAVPVLGALALGAQRLLPLLQQAYQSWSSVAGNFHAFGEVMAIIRTPVPAAEGPGDASQLPFQDAVELVDVGYRHASGGFALAGINIRLERGEHVGVTGPTGGGKSTLLDLLMGLLQPEEGEIRVDGRRLDPSLLPAWQASLAHVPQSVYLADDTIAANIMFPRPPAAEDKPRLLEAARLAQLEPFLESLPGGLSTLVGERGVRLSGGQRQRIGIARALVRRPRLLILDEATSALDEATETAVMAALRALPHLTLLSVAHRASTLARCDRVLEVVHGSVRRR